MTKPLPRLLAVCAAGAVGLALAQAPASAASFDQAYLSPYVNFSISGSGTACTSTTPNPTTPPGKEIPQNGVAVRGAVGGSQGWKSAADATDTATVAASASGSARATGTGTTPKSIELSFSGRASMTTSKPAGFACSMRGSASLGAMFEFTTTTPLLATMSYQRTGSAGSAVSISNYDSNHYEEFYGDAFAGTGSATVYVPRGRYRGYLSGGVLLPKTKARTQVTGSGNVKITFVVPGSIAVAPKGKARKLVTLPSARSCATRTATPRLTTKAKKLKKAKKITFTVNGKKAKTLKGKKLKKGKVVPIPIAAKATAKLGVKVTLKNGRKVTASATYRPCA